MFLAPSVLARSRQRIESPLKYQTRCISVFLNTEAYAVGSIEGRVGIQMVDDAYKESVRATTVDGNSQLALLTQPPPPASFPALHPTPHPAFLDAFP